MTGSPSPADVGEREASSASVFASDPWPHDDIGDNYSDDSDNISHISLDEGELVSDLLGETNYS